MVKYLSEQGWNIEVISELPNYPTGNVYSGYDQSFIQSEKMYGSWIHRVWVWANPRRNIVQQLGIFGSFLFSSILYAITHPKKYDIVYATSPPIFAGIAGAVIARLFGAKFVLEIRDIWPDSAVDAGKIEEDSFYYRIGKRIERTLYRMADRIIPVTHCSEEIIANRGGDGKTSVVHNGVDLDHFYKREEPQEEIDEPYDHSKFRVGYVGSLGVIHDLDTFVQAAKLVEDDPEFEFVIVGDGGARDKLLEALEEYNPANITWVGLKEHEKVPAYISSFDVAINPVYNAKIFESIITVKFYEYLACETPVISLANGVMAQESQNYKSSLTLKPESPEQLAEALRSIKQGEMDLKSEVKDSRARIVANYSRKELAGRTSELLTDLLNDS